jgi:nitrite reductase/ring-hydroxylating ferredoxin subunit
VRSASLTGSPELHLATGRTVSSERVVLATGIPILDRGLAFAKVEPKRSYLLAYRGVPVPRAMYISAGSSSRSLRDVPNVDGDVFLVGGSGHTVGRTRSERQHLDELRAWTAEHFAGAVETHAWSAQDDSPYDGLPLVGRLPRGGGRIYYATGYDKWGMTNGVAAALSLAAQMLNDRPPPWADAYEHRPPKPRGAAHIGALNAKVGVAQGVSTARSQLRPAPESVAEGAGVVGRDGLVPTGVATVVGRTCRVTAVCTHVGGILKWNDAERSWDCPLHGSRFSPDGEVLEGPATRPLQRRDSGEA